VITTDQIQAVANTITTVGQAKAVLGAESDQLAIGYTIVGTIGMPDSSSGLLTNLLHDYTPLGFATDQATSDARQAAKDLLDQANLYAQSVYLTLPAQADSWPLDATTQGKVAGALLSGLAAVNQVDAVAAELHPNYPDEYLAALKDAISGLVAGIVSAAKSVVAAVASGLGWSTIAIVVGVILIVLFIVMRSKPSVTVGV
jgi:hypothetical protein